MLREQARAWRSLYLYGVNLGSTVVYYVRSEFVEPKYLKCNATRFDHTYGRFDLVFGLMTL